MDRNLNELLKWGIENSDVSQHDPSTQALPPHHAAQTLNPELLQALMGGPSDADRMKQFMEAIQSPEVSLENKVIAFDNFELLVENIDNANNLEPLGLWTPLVKQLENVEPQMREMAAWCLGTAVQNNVKAQERMLALGAIPILVTLSIDDPSQAVRKKAILALSSGVRNYQPSLDAMVSKLPEDHKVDGRIDAGDMEAIDSIVQRLREESAKRG